jgi:hypothetical protein
MRVIKTLVRMALFAVVGIAVLLGLLWLDHTRRTTLPTPTGPFAVGRTTYAWSDAAQADPLGSSWTGSRFDTVEVRSSSLLVPSISFIGIERIPEILQPAISP